MRKLFSIIAACLLSVVCFLGIGCYATQKQTLEDVKGTYELTVYTVKEKNKGEDGVVAEASTDLLASQEIKAYLVVTGGDEGYYVYQSNTVAAHVVEVALAYETDEEETDKYTFVSYTSLTPTEIEFNKFGITKNGLNFSRPVTYTTINDKVFKQKGYTVKWSKKDDATDLSYVFSQLGELPLP